VEGEKLIEPTVVSGDKDGGIAFFAESNYSSVLDDNINAMLECYHSCQKSGSFAKFLALSLHTQTTEARSTTSGPTIKVSRTVYV
jgi:hypothetical protein